MEKWDYQKAMSVNNTESIVYAYQFTEKGGFDFFPSPIDGAPDCAIIKIGGEIEAVCRNDWIVWMSKTREYLLLKDSAFRVHYTLYDDLPPKLKAVADKFPDYYYWCEKCEMDG